MRVHDEHAIHKKLRRTRYRPSMFYRLSLPLLLAAFAGKSSAFVPSQASVSIRAEIGSHIGTSRVSLASTADDENDDAPAPEAETTATKAKKNKATLGLITFDLDDTLYPVGPVFTEANQAFANAMHNFGYDGIQPNDIAETGRAVREELAAQSPDQASALSFTDTRMKAIRRQMEGVRLLRSLEDVAKEWATPVSGLNPVVVENCKKFAMKEVSDSQVQAVYNAWEMERHHSAERHLYPEVIEVLESIKKEHPGVVIGAVTDGRANPLLMPFTLAPYFDFCVSWEDDQGGRQKYFKELSEATDEEQLMWIYEAALDKYREIECLRTGLKKRDETCEVGEDDCERIWMHVGDDLAYDVGGSAACGARTILMELADKYEQTERVDKRKKNRPVWDLMSKAEIEQRERMNEEADDQVTARVAFISRLPETINDILEDIDEEGN